MIEVENLSKIYGDGGRAVRLRAVRLSDESDAEADFAARQANRDENWALRDVSFRVERGEVLGLLGPNGAGKTTTMRILTCLMAPTGGTARIAGFDILRQSLDVRRNIGYLPENAPLYPEMTVRDYLLHVACLRGVGKKKRPERLEAALDAGKIEDRADTIIAKLSKGLRQRVGLAQAIIHDPPVLILDEPSAGLDPRQRVETRRLIKALSREHTIILSTHILPDVEAACSRVAIIHRGRLVTQETTTSTQEADSIIELEMARPASDAAAQLKKLPGVLEVETRSSRESDTEKNAPLIFVLRCARDNREAVARFCSERNWGLREIKSARRNLEDIFLEATRDWV